MNKFDRIQHLHSIFSSRRTPISLVDLMERLECGEATVKRLIGKFRYEMGAPIRYDRHRNGYLLDRDDQQKHEIPGLWFTTEELYALLTIQEMLATLQPGLLRRELSPLRQRIEKILDMAGSCRKTLAERLRIITIAGRKVEPRYFADTATATLQRKRLKITYHPRSSDNSDKRTISPQRLLLYRHNWYLDAWCHSRSALRTFSLDKIQSVSILAEDAHEVSIEQLEAHFSPTYGIFAGEASSSVVLKFTPEQAKWVADEEWHPGQKGEWRPNGSYILTIPYGDPRELILDILRYGHDVEVLSPPALREEVKKRHMLAFQQYR